MVTNCKRFRLSSIHALHFNIKVALALLFLQFSFSTLCQLTLFENFSTRENLPSAEVYDIYQDNNNRLWVCTDRGVSHYDGINYQSLKIDGSTFQKSTLQFFPQSNGSLWACTIDELYIINTEKLSIQPYEFNELLKVSSQELSIEDLHIDNKGEVYVSYRFGSGLSRIDASGKILEKPSPQSEQRAILFIQQFNDDDVFKYIGAGSDTHFNGSSIFAHEISGGNYFKISVSYNKKLIVHWNYVYLLEDDIIKFKIQDSRRTLRAGFLKDGRFWVGFLGGGLKIYNQHGEMEGHYLKTNSVTGVILDHENNIWVSTLSNGLYKTPNLQAEFYDFEKSNHVKSLTKSVDGSLYSVMYDGRILRQTKDGFVEYSKSINLHALFIEPFASSTITIIDNILNIDRKDFFFINSPRKVSEQNTNSIFIASNSFIFKYFNGALTKYPIKGMAYDVCSFNNQVFIGKQDGLYSYDERRQKEKRIPIENLKTTIIDIDYRSNGLVFGSKGSGLFFYNNTSYNITERDGLSSNYINEVYVENDSVIWVCTSKGLDRLLMLGNKLQRIQSFRMANGLADNDILDVELLDQRIWVATRNGLSSLPFSVINQNHLDIPYRIQPISIRVKGQHVDDLMNLNHSQNGISIKFQAISLSNGDKIHYRYKLNDSDTIWRQTTNQSIELEALAPGDYQITIQANVNGKWQKNPLVYAIRIYPPYYETWWFISGIASLIILLIYVFFKFRVLSYNRDIIREILRQLLKRIRKRSMNFIIKQQGEYISINSQEVLFVNSSGNYIQINTADKSYVIRYKISDFMTLVPDPLEYIQVRKSHIVRIDQIQARGSNSIRINNEEIVIGRIYKNAVAEAIPYKEI
jgi:ligand-binding sensor domain-containing protein